MHMNRRTSYLVLASLLIVSIFIQPVIAELEEPFLYLEYTGPIIEKIDYKIIPGGDRQVLALQDGDIDLVGEFLDPAFISTLTNTEGDIEVAYTLRNGYGYFTINCERYPLNITAFRRAFAFALDKERISDEVWEGLSQPLDSPVPVLNPFSIDGQLPYDYHHADSEYGNQLLDAAGFIDIDNDGFREAPDGSDFDIQIEASSTNVAIETCFIAKEALERLSIDVYYWPTDFWEYPPAYITGDYDIYFLGTSFSDLDVDWLAYEYWSEYADKEYWNFPRWGNDSYDSWRDQLLHSTSFDDVYEAAAEMQSIWIYECPAVICYENLHLTAYRANRFVGFVNDIHQGVASWWTNFRAHLRDEQGGPLGGTLTWSNPLDIDTFNFMTTNSAYDWNVLQMLYDSLLRQSAKGEDMPWLIESYLIETHTDNVNIPEGNTRITFDMLQNITWTDGTPMTAEDVAFSLNYFREVPGQRFNESLVSLSAAYAPTPHKVVVEFENESYWHLHVVGYKPIIPKHIFQELGADGWRVWNPTPPSEAMVTSGPFNISEYNPGDNIELTKNAHYFRVPPSTNTDTITPPNGLFGISLVHIFVTIPCIVVIVLVGIKWKINTGMQYLPLCDTSQKNRDIPVHPMQCTRLGLVLW